MCLGFTEKLFEMSSSQNQKQFDTLRSSHFDTATSEQIDDDLGIAVATNPDEVLFDSDKKILNTSNGCQSACHLEAFQSTLLRLVDAINVVAN